MTTTNGFTDKQEQGLLALVGVVDAHGPGAPRVREITYNPDGTVATITIEHEDGDLTVIEGDEA